MLKAKDDSVQGLTKGVELLQVKQRRLHHGSCLVCVAEYDLVQLNEPTVEAKNVIIATGSEVRHSQVTPFK